MTDIDASQMVKSVKAYKLLQGARGTTPAQMDQIEETLLRLSQLVNDYKFIDELDINPLLISEKTGEGIAVDGRIKVRMEEAPELGDLVAFESRYNFPEDVIGNRRK